MQIVPWGNEDPTNYPAPVSATQAVGQSPATRGLRDVGVIQRLGLASTRIS